MEICIRQETAEERREIEALTRAAFWNVYRPGCTEHYLLRVMRGSPAYIKELGLAALCGGRIVGHIAYTRSRIAGAHGETASVTFGPLSVLPEFQRRGIGGALVRRSMEKAAELGFTSVVIFGDPAYYSRFGFEAAEKFGIRRSDGKFAAALLACELVPGALREAAGRFLEDAVFDISEEEAEAFDKAFPPAEKLRLPSQERFEALAADVRD